MRAWEKSCPAPTTGPPETRAPRPAGLPQTTGAAEASAARLPPDHKTGRCPGCQDCGTARQVGAGFSAEKPKNKPKNKHKKEDPPPQWVFHSAAAMDHAGEYFK